MSGLDGVVAADTVGRTLVVLVMAVMVVMLEKKLTGLEVIV